METQTLERPLRDEIEKMLEDIGSVHHTLIPARPACLLGGGSGRQLVSEVNLGYVGWHYEKLLEILPRTRTAVGELLNCGFD